MAAKVIPVITYVEILCRAIRNIEDEIKRQQDIWGNIPECKAMLDAFNEERHQKLVALKEMYRIETGTNYN